MTDPVPSGDLIDKFKGVELDRFDSHLLLGLIVFLGAHLSVVLLWRQPIKDYENIVSWLIAGMVALALLFVAGTRIKRQRTPKVKTNTTAPAASKP